MLFKRRPEIQTNYDDLSRYKRQAPILFRNSHRVSKSIENSLNRDQSNSKELLTDGSVSGIVNRRHVSQSIDNKMNDIMTWSGKPEKSRHLSKINKGDKIVLGTDDVYDEYNPKKVTVTEYHPEEYYKDYTPYQRRMIHYFGHHKKNNSVLNNQSDGKSLNTSIGICEREFKDHKKEKYDPIGQRGTLKKECTEFSTIHKVASKYTKLTTARKQNLQRSNIFNDPDKENFYKNLRSKDKPVLKFYGRGNRKLVYPNQPLTLTFRNNGFYTIEDKDYHAYNNRSFEKKNRRIMNRSMDDVPYMEKEVVQTQPSADIYAGKKKGVLSHITDVRKELYNKIRKDNPNQNFAEFRRKMDYLSYEEGKKLYDTNYNQKPKQGVLHQERYEITNFGGEENIPEVKKALAKKGIQMYDIKNESDYAKPKITFSLRNNSSKFGLQLGRVKKALKEEKGYNIGKCKEQSKGKKPQ
ncbi:MAG: hypothetical protein MJ252_23685 [archaeon]|nr:hypothetical protein [archaeon]